MKRQRSHNNTVDPWISLREQAECLLVSNRRTETLSWKPPFHALDSHQDSSFSNIITYSFPIPCGNASTVQESTSTLLAARAYAKAGHSKFAWQALESLVSVQASNGLLPKFRYSSLLANDTTSLYINNTDIPNWVLFQNVSLQYLPPTTALVTRAGVHSSGRLSALPLHASLVLDVFYLSNQTKSDVANLQRHFDTLYRQHDFIHTVIMRGCTNPQHSGFHYSNNNNNNNKTTIAVPAPCYNVVHPWETLLLHTRDIVSTPYWKEALSQVHALVQESRWTPPIPNSNTTTTTRDDDDDEALLFLAECMSNATKSSVHCTNTSTTTSKSSMDCEDAILRHCPFAMLHVGYGAALLQSNVDLLQMARILQDLKLPNANDEELPRKILQLQAWKRQSIHVMDNLLWNEEYQTFLSRNVVFDQTHGENTTGTTIFVPRKATKFLKHAVVDNFMSLWTFPLNESRRDAMIFHMLERKGDYAFDCGQYPLPSRGGCSITNATTSPQMNYIVSRGLQNNDAVGTSHYLANSTLNLVCGLPNQVVHPNKTQQYCRDDVLFWSDYFAITGMPFTIHPSCGETASAASIYNVLVADPPFHYTPAPPIGSHWVIGMVVAELGIAFLIGVSCLLLNLNLLRRLNSETDALFGASVHRTASGGTDMQYFSAAASLEEIDEDGDEQEEHAVNGEAT